LRVCGRVGLCAHAGCGLSGGAAAPSARFACARARACVCVHACERARVRVQSEGGAHWDFYRKEQTAEEPYRTALVIVREMLRQVCVCACLCVCVCWCVCVLCVCV
jgi:hypothetical protein